MTARDDNHEDRGSDTHEDPRSQPCSDDAETIEVDVDALAKRTAARIADDSLPESIGGFRIIGKLGGGGMGVVLEAEQQEPRRRVALKIIRGWGLADETQVRMFQREAASLARLSHPGIAAIYESGRSESGEYYLAMELVDGVTLSEFLKRRPRHADRDEVVFVLRLFQKIALAVQYAHQRGVIHRDLKLSNILVANGNTVEGLPPVKVLDFGLARITDHDVDQSRITKVGEVRGTLAYMSPELAQGGADILDVRSDVYGLGVVLFRMLTGKLPHALNDVPLVEALRIIATEAPRSLRDLWRGTQRVDPDLETIVGKALEREVESRYSSAGAMADDIDRYLADQPILARPPSTTYQLKKLVARNRLATAFLGAIAVGLVLFGIVMGTLYQRATEAEAEAVQKAETASKVSDLLVEFFRQSDPSESRGQEITARELLDHAAGRIDAELTNQPQLRARLTGTVGTVYVGLGLYERARPLLERALSERRALHSEENLEVAESEHALGSFLVLDGAYDEAVLHLRSAVDLRRQLLGPRHADTAGSLSALAEALYYRGDNAQAEPLVRQAIEIYAEPSIELSEGVGEATEILGMVLSELSRHDEAVEEMERALAMHVATHGTPHVKVSESLNNLGVVLGAAGKHEAAAKQYRLGLEMSRELYPGPHPSKATSINNVALDALDRGQHDLALSLLTEAFNMHEQSHGLQHPQTLVTQQMLAQVHFSSGRESEAVRMQRAAVAGMGRVFGDEHPEVAGALNRLAFMLMHAPSESVSQDEAYAATTEVLVSRRRLFAEVHPMLAFPLAMLAQLQLEKGDLEQAQQTLETARKSFDAGSKPKFEAAWMDSLEGAIRAQRGDVKAARALLESSLKALSGPYRPWMCPPVFQRAAQARLDALGANTGE